MVQAVCSRLKPIPELEQEAEQVEEDTSSISVIETSSELKTEDDKDKKPKKKGSHLSVVNIGFVLDCRLFLISSMRQMLNEYRLKPCDRTGLFLWPFKWSV